MHMFHLPMLRVRRYDPAPEFLFFKRLFDILASVLALITLSPVLLIVAIAVKSDGGPALYKQRRLTKDGKTFDVLKFRSMRIDAEKDGIARLSTGDQDDRITPVGRVIRKFRLDELPPVSYTHLDVYKRQGDHRHADCCWRSLCGSNDRH